MKDYYDLVKASKFRKRLVLYNNDDDDNIFNSKKKTKTIITLLRFKLTTTVTPSKAKSAAMSPSDIGSALKDKHRAYL